MHDATDNLSSLDTETYFAPAERDSDSDIRALYQLIISDMATQSLLDAIPLTVFLLNSKRQIVAVNQRSLKAFGDRIDAIIGKRPGELIGCVHSGDGPDGCGTSVACKACGAVNSILQSQETQFPQTEECRIVTVHEESFDWKVTSSPIELAGHSLLCLVIEDINDQKRRQILERTFFHDIINTVGALVGFSQMLVDESNKTDELNEIIRLADELMEEVQSQRELTLAESGDLIPKPKPIELSFFLNRIVELYQSHPVAIGRDIVLLPFENEMLTTDARLLKRVLGNMVKNALEASTEGQVVTVSCENDVNSVVLSVHNSTVMTDEVKLQMFKRSFSTKGDPGRGIGTYSIKLLGEKYLGGQISFASEPGEGTVFSITLPVQG